VLCGFVELEGAVLLWSDCGSVELELLLDGLDELLLLDGLAELLELCEPTDELLEDGLAVCPLLLVLVLGAAVVELEDDDDGVWLLVDGSWSDCG